VDKPDGVVGEQGIGAAGDFAVMADVVGGIGGAHSGDVAAAAMCYRTIFGISFRVWSHIDVAKYENAEGVVNEDFVSYDAESLDLIISISTLDYLKRMNQFNSWREVTRKR
jgi:hypothetical protein